MKRSILTVAATVFLGQVSWVGHVTGQPIGFDPYLEVTIPFSPLPALAGGARFAAYEVHLTNYGWDTLAVTGVQVSWRGGNSTLLEWDQASVGGHMIRPGTEGLSPEEQAVLPGGMSALLLMWVPLYAAPAEEELVHRIDVVRRSARRGAVTGVVEAAARVRSGSGVRRVGAPVRGGDWVAQGGPGPNTHHRRAWFVIDGRIRFGQRFAIDLSRVVVPPQGPAVTRDGDPERNESYFGYGNEVLAVADARVLRAVDDIPENVPRSRARAVEISPETIMGNVVILDLGDGVYAAYAHLKPGSVRVREGERVTVGQVIGQVGNSGDSMGPHLHFQLSEGVPLKGSDGVPFTFAAFERLGSCTGGCKLTGSELRRGETPLDMDIVRFAR